MNYKYFISKLLIKSSPLFYSVLNYYYLHIKKGVLPKKLDLKNPKRYNERLLEKKIYHDNSNLNTFVDKYLVRDYVTDAIGDKYLVPLLQVPKSIDEIDYDILPDKFVIKLTHGSGYNIVIPDKKRIDQDEVYGILKKWMYENYYYKSGENIYDKLDPTIIIEKYLDAGTGKSLNDYKIFCFNGEPKMVQVDVDRYTNHTRSYYDLKWNKIDLEILYPNYKGLIEKPKNLEIMIDISKKLSKGFDHVRIDLYEVKGRIYFGEMTFFHEGGVAPIIPAKYDKILGEYFE